MINEVIESICADMNLSFGHGTRSHSNLQAASGTVAWLYPFIINDDRHKSGAIISKYNVLMDFQMKCSIGAKKETLALALKDMFVISKTFEAYLFKNEKIKSVENMRREPLYHRLDNNLTGYALSCIIELHHEEFIYPCP